MRLLAEGVGSAPAAGSSPCAARSPRSRPPNSLPRCVGSPPRSASHRPGAALGPPEKRFQAVSGARITLSFSSFTYNILELTEFYLVLLHFMTFYFIVLHFASLLEEIRNFLRSRAKESLSSLSSS